MSSTTKEFFTISSYIAFLEEETKKRDAKLTYAAKRGGRNLRRHRWCGCRRGDPRCKHLERRKSVWKGSAHAFDKDGRRYCKIHPDEPLRVYKDKRGPSFTSYRCMPCKAAAQRRYVQKRRKDAG